VVFQVLVVDPSPVARAALAELVRAAGDGIDVAELVSPAGRGGGTVGLDPNLIILTESTPETIAATRTAYPPAEIVVLGLADDARYERRALEAGADRYLPRERAPDELSGLVREVAGLYS